MKTYSEKDFTRMPWKNGGGTTTELFRLPESGAFHLRLSRAQVGHSGPFSSFPGVIRHLLLLKGEGCTLHFPEGPTLLTLKSPPLVFSGETAVDCELLRGPLEDFNVMIDQNWGEATVEVIKESPEEIELLCQSDLLFAYDPEEESLLELTRGESVTLFSHYLIVVEVKKKAGKTGP